MRKKTIVWAYLLILSLGTILSLYIPKNEVAAKDAIVIPGQAIRLRILANSDLDADQALKRKVRDAVNEKIAVWVQDLTSITEARKVIKSKLPEIQATAEAVVKQEGSKQAVNVKFGKVQFPTKLYGQFLYPAGYYEAILITLGEGKGANWWCVLFPPLCFLDFSNGIAVSKGFEDKKAQAATKVEPVEKVKSDSDTEDLAGPKVKTNAETSTDPGKKVKDETSTDPEKQAKDVVESAPNSNDEESEIASSEETVKSDSKQVVAKGVQKQVQSVEVAALDTTEKESNSKHEGTKSQTKQAPVYTTDDEEPVKVKFFVVELWNKIF
ncbi:stage II sporulation protein R [Bacillus sp. EB600]|uniref:stage II sporulation protein R n=1 Tax=Bacillus sp. EB600 TaxID=2806345 RepID=UPI0028117C11|nr:stage II sporulation protein R [Bacillus sp. EB600]MCQ6281766.1 stage II sporulation protein R [Bacillus sp. EB600]